MHIKINKKILALIFFLSFNSNLYSGGCCLCSTTSMSMATSSIQSFIQPNMSKIRTSVDLIIQKYKNEINTANNQRHQLIKDKYNLDIQIELITKEINKYSKKIEEHLYRSNK